jgi:hypothetical protein
MAAMTSSCYTSIAALKQYEMSDGPSSREYHPLKLFSCREDATSTDAVTGSLRLQATVQTVKCGPQLSLGFHLNWEIVADAKTKIFHRMFREPSHSVLKYRCN